MLPFQSSGSDVKPLRYLQRWKSLARISSGSMSYGDGSATTGGPEQSSSSSLNMFSSLVNKGSSFVMEGVKNLVVKKQHLPITKIVDEIMEVQ